MSVSHDKGTLSGAESIAQDLKNTLSDVNPTPKEKEYTFADVRSISDDTASPDLLLVIHDKVYDCQNFIDEHPGGDEVMRDVLGQDATEAFEDIGHSDEAREILEGLKVGVLKRVDGDPAPPRKAYQAPSPSGSADGSFGFGAYAVLLVGGLVAYFGYQYLQAHQTQTSGSGVA